MKQELKKRLMSLVWRLGGMSAAVILAFIANNLDLFNLSPGAIGVIGLIIGELTKITNNYFQDKIV